LFEHILTDFEISQFLHTPIPPLFFPLWIDVKLPECLWNFEISSKSHQIFDDYLETLEGACTGAQKSRKSRIAKNQLKHTQTITEVHMKEF